MSNTFCCCCSPCQDQNQIAINMPDVQSMQQVDDLIGYIDQLISKLDSGGQNQVGRPNSVATSINSGGNLMEKLSKRLNWHVCKKSLMSALDRETRKVLCNVLTETEPIPYLGVALSIIAHLLERAEQASSNKEKCLCLLRDMFVLAEHMKNLETHLGQNKLNDILVFIVKGTLICARQMEPHSICRFIFAPLDAADLENLKSDLQRLYPDLQLKAQTKILNRLPTIAGPSQGKHPTNAVGIDQAQKEVIKLLDLTELSRRVVVIYGVGGIGKTTLATAVFNGLDLTGHNYCRVDIDQDCKHSDLQSIQEQILRDLFQEKLKLNNCNEGREKLWEAFGKASKPIFLFIDNALKKTDIEILLPIEHLSRLHEKSRILVTTRNLNEADIFQRQRGIQFSSHRVDSLSEREAKRLLCRIALGDANLSFDSDVHMDGLLKICGGIPLYLTIVGSQLSRLGNTVSACDEILKYHEEWQRTGLEGGEDRVRERIVDFVYRRLTGPSQEAFLDIAFFYCDWERDKVGDIVGGVQLQELERAALVSTSEEDEEELEMLNNIMETGWTGEMLKKTMVKVKMHDIVRARGRKLSAGNRVTDLESLAILLRDEQKLQQTKGIWLPRYPRHEVISAKHLDLMSKSLRVLSLSRMDMINGECKRAFEELRFLDISYEDMLPIDLRKSRKLVCFMSNKGHRLPQLPESLLLLRLAGEGDAPVSLDIRQLISLRELELSNSTLVNFETCISQLKYLRSLRLHSCRGFTSIPLPQSLQILCFAAPRDFPVSLDIGHLISLRNLQLLNISLVNFETCISQSKSLQYLRLDSCRGFTSIPETFGNISSLQMLKMASCEELERLPENFGNLSSMSSLDISGCSLERLPEDFGNLSSLKTLYMFSCSKLEILPDSFGNLFRCKH